MTKETYIQCVCTADHRFHIQYNRDIHSYKRKVRPLHLRIQSLDQSDTILSFCLHLVVPHDYVISFFVNNNLEIILIEILLKYFF